MNVQSEISDEDFSSFLKSLGVDTYKRSFEWMLNDSNFGGFLGWMYNNLDYNNALSPREEYRYKELEKNSLLLSPEDLEAHLASIQEEYPGICLPGDKQGLEDVKLDISMQKERLVMLEKHGNVIDELLEKNELLNEELNMELVKLNSAQQQYTEDQSVAAEQSLSLAEDVETITDEVVRIIADQLHDYRTCQFDKEKSSRFLTFGPLDAYRQSQALFRSHFDAYTSKKFSHKLDSGNDEELRNAVVEAKSLEDRLYNTLCNYVEAKSELSCEQAKLDLVANYAMVHPSQIDTLVLEAQSALELLVQEETILNQQVQAEIKSVVASRTKLAMDTTTKAALAIREQTLSSVTHLLSVSQRALAVDSVLYCALRHELHTVQQFAQFAAQLKQHLLCEGEAVASRIDSMTEITTEHESCEKNLQTSDRLSHTLYKILGAKETTDASVLVKLYDELVRKCKMLERDVEDEFEKTEQTLVEFKHSLQPLRTYIWDGCTKQPNCWDRTIASLTHTLRQEMDKTEKDILHTGGLLTSVKNGDKTLRKLWQWFLVDTEKLLAVTKGI